MIILKPNGYVYNSIDEPTDDNWNKVTSIIKLDNNFSKEALIGLNEFSHVEIFFHFHKLDDSKICTAARHLRNNKSFPKVDVFAQRGKNRPNKIGAAICKLIKVEDMSLEINGLDAINGTPVLDIKPVFREYQPQNVEQPAWVSELMKDYF
ncbi:MAG: TrmO family methyltransferase [Ignavibacteriaceae bacterium]|nr:TrmO family methyltransferase [Ignavibacteriaceae bacterium]